MNDFELTMETLAAITGTDVDTAYGSLGVPVYMTNNYLFKDVKDGADRCMSPEFGHCYTRISNPTTDALERTVAALEHAQTGVAFSSGVAALSTFALTLLASGDHAIVDETTYSATAYLFNTLLPKFGVETSVIDCADIGLLEKTIKSNTKLLIFETPCNPTLKLIDIAAVCALAKKNGIITCVDNTFCSPFLQNPILLGADAIMHSSTKYICGHGDAIGGMLVGTKELMDTIRGEGLKNLGGCASPFNSFLMIRGLKTLDIRMKQHCANAKKVAAFLEKHPKIEHVYYPGLKSHPQYDLAKKQMKDFGGLLTFEVKGGFDAGVKLMNNVKLCRLAVSLGEGNTLVCHPASMTHWYVPKEQREANGITDGLVRMSLGLENVNDVIADLKKALI
ncbi:MAG: aminotransferase class I/II-fold pyridoxal phosphate-dependent enzyme [Eubacteriales bacterium]